MSAVQAAGGTGAAAATAATAAVNATSSESQDRFLKLLVTQLKNQDPLNPMDNAQMTTQMAQISSLQGIEKLNTTLEGLAASFSGGQAVEAAGLVGREVMTPGSAMLLAAGKAQGGIVLPQALDQLSVTIRDAAGSVVHRVELGPHPQGLVRFEWDGVTDNGTAALEGAYQFSLAGTANGKDVALEPQMIGRVMGVSSGAAGTTLDLGRLGTAALAQVKTYF